MAEKTNIPPIGYIVVQDVETGQKFWADPNSVKAPPPGPPLSEELVDRVKAYKKILGDAEPMSLEETLTNLRRDTHPEKEIKAWENIAKVYDIEIRLRPNNTTNERIILCHVLVLASMGMSAGQILSSAPQIKSFPNLDRVVQLFNVMRLE